MGWQQCLLGNQAWRSVLGGIVPELGRQAGLTLIELLVSMLLAGLLMMVGVQSFARWTQNQQIRVAAESILNGLQLARGEAVKRNANVRFALGDQTSWSVIEAPGGTTLQSRSSQEGSPNAAVTPVPNGATTVTFNSLGRIVANADGSAPLTQVEVNNNRGDRPLRITIGNGGNARMCDPSDLLTAGDPRRC